MMGSGERLGHEPLPYPPFNIYLKCQSAHSAKELTHNGANHKPDWKREGAGAICADAI